MEPGYTFLFSQKIPANEPPPGSQRGPYGERNPFTGHFCISLEILIKIPLNKKFPPLSKALGKERPSMVPKSGAPMKVDALFQSLN
jgi:hypothetical protein